MTKPRDDPYLWVTWITDLLAGEAQCQWAAWFRAHFQRYDKQPTTFDQAAWNAQHGELVRTRAAKLRSAGYTVFVEDQNKFSLRGQACTLGGKPDIVAVNADDALVVDCKTGQRRGSDYFQILVYMLVLPYAHALCENRELRGELEYQDGTLSVPADKLTSDVKDLIRVTIERAAGPEPTPRVPSAAECRFCEITRLDCPERVDAEPPARNVYHNLF